MKLKSRLTLAASLALSLCGMSHAATELVIATVNNGHMIEMQKLTQALREGQPRHQAQVGDAGRRRAAPARHHRHRHQGRPVRRDDHRHVRDADLGQEGLAERAQDRRRLRRRRPAAGHAQRPVGRRQALRRAVLRRKLDADVPQGPGRQGRHHVRRAPDLGPTSQTLAAKIHDPKNGVYGICLRGKPGWGDNMAFLTTHGQHLRRPVVRHELEAAARQQALEGRDHLLRRPAEELRPARLVGQQLQRDPGAVQRRQVRHVDRRDDRRLVHHRPEAEQGGRQGGLRAGARTPSRPRAPTGCGPGRWRFRRAPRSADAAQKFITWATSQGLHQPGRQGKGLGRGAHRHAQVAPTPTPSS